MNILFICSEYPPFPHGGLGTVTYLISQGLAKLGHKILIAGLYRDVKKKCDISYSNEVTVFRIRSFGNRFPFSILSRIRLFYHVKYLINKLNIQLLEIPDYQGLGAFWPKLKVPIVVRLHGTDTFIFDGMGKKVSWIHYTFEHKNLATAHYILAVSHYIALKTKTLFHLTCPATIIYNPVNINDFIPFGTVKQPKVVYVGTLMRLKGVYALIEAWPLVIKEVPEARLHFYGKDFLEEDGRSVKNNLISMLDSNQLQTVFFHGHVEKNVIVEAYQSAAAAIFPSFVESLGMAALEAMACECPTIFTRMASGPEIIRDGTDGLLIDPRNPAEIANSIIRILKDSCWALELAKAGRQKVIDLFSLDKIISENESYFKSIISERFL